MTLVYEYAENDPHRNCHKIETTTYEDLRLGRRAYIDQRCEECRAEIAEVDRLHAEIAGLRTLITEWADAEDTFNNTVQHLDWRDFDADEQQLIKAITALRKAIGR